MTTFKMQDELVDGATYHIDFELGVMITVHKKHVVIKQNGSGVSIPRDAAGLDDLLAYFEARNKARLENAKAKPQGLPF